MTNSAPLLQSAPLLRLFYGAINTTHGPLADVRVRQAIELRSRSRHAL